MQASDEREDEVSQKQNMRPLYFLSHRLSLTHEKWSVNVKEFYSIIYALQGLHNYVWHSQLTIRTDSKGFL